MGKAAVGGLFDSDLPLLKRLCSSVNVFKCSCEEHNINTLTHEHLNTYRKNDSTQFLHTNQNSNTAKVKHKTNPAKSGSVKIASGEIRSRLNRVTLRPVFNHFLHTITVNRSQFKLRHHRLMESKDDLSRCFAKTLYSELSLYFFHLVA